MLYLSCENNENKQKEAGFGTFFLKKQEVTRFSLTFPWKCEMDPMVPMDQGNMVPMYLFLGGGFPSPCS